MSDTHESSEESAPAPHATTQADVDQAMGAGMVAEAMQDAPAADQTAANDALGQAVEEGAPESAPDTPKPAE